MVPKVTIHRDFGEAVVVHEDLNEDALVALTA